MSVVIPNFLPFSPLPRTQRKLSNLPRRGWKRRKLKLSVRSHFGFDSVDAVSVPFENLFQSLISQFPSRHSLDLLVPALGLASGAAVYFSRAGGKLSPVLSKRRPRDDKFVGEWILFSSPTPFNRFVTLRCPSITFESSELLEDVNEKLVKEDRHFVRLNRGRIQAREGEAEAAKKLVYQRVCVRTEDGGVISLDWPANLDLEEERGLDTTVLIVPGTAEGSMEEEIKDYVCRCFGRGFFPVVMNPRGCAGSPLTTPRLFTAADSDDISTAIQFINKARPWTTMMSIGWGYGANMLTKYLAEVGQRTPLIAAVCIDNPFDLEETTRTTPYHILLDQKLKSGLIDILRSNKELFQGRAKGFDVEKALLATSIRDFEKAISMVSYGYDEIEAFYAKSSTRDIVGKVKIPLLFIQNDNGTVPMFSTPRSLIAENPFTSLLLCSYLPSKEFTSGRSTVSWCQHLTIEWMTAAELGLLKGRHPLLNDVDITVSPSKGLTMLESTVSHRNGVGKPLKFPNLDALDENSMNSVKQAFERDYMSANFHSRAGQESKGQSKGNMHLPEHSKAIDADLVGDEIINPVDDERGQVLQTAKVVFNMLDVTMPNTLTEEQKKKVLAAVGQGESFIKALQDAVPADVREKLTTAVSVILDNHEFALKIDKLLSLEQIPVVASKLKSKVQENYGLPSANRENEDPHTSTQTQKVDQLEDGSKKSQTSQGKDPRLPEYEIHASDNMPKSVDPDQLQPTISHEIDTADSDQNTTNDFGNDEEAANSSGVGISQVSDSKGIWSETFAKPELLPSRTEVSAVDKIIEQDTEKDGGKNQSSIKDESTTQQNEVKTAGSSVEQTKDMPSGQSEDKFSTPVSVSGSQLMEKEGRGGLRKEEIIGQAGSTDVTNLPTFNVSQALDALTGIDDSTQVAVNSVFHVIEDMITQLEEGRDDANQAVDVVKKDEDRGINAGNEPNEKVEVEEEKIGYIGKNKIISDDYKLEKLEDNRNHKCLPSDTLFDVNSSNHFSLIEKSARDSSFCRERDADVSGESDSKSYLYEGTGRMKNLLGRKLSSEDPVELLNRLFPPGAPSINKNLYTDPLYRICLRKYVLSKMGNTKSPDLDSTLFLDYFPEEGKWKLLELPEDDSDIIDHVESHGQVGAGVESCLTSTHDGMEDIIEPSYEILDSDTEKEEVEKCEKENNFSGEIGDGTIEEILFFVKRIMLDTLKLEVDRRLSATDIEEMQPILATDMELVANAVCLSVGQMEHTFFTKGEGHTSDKYGVLEGPAIIKAISSAFQETSYLRRVLPVGVIVGSSLANLRKYFDVSAVSSNSQSEGMDLDHTQLNTDADKMVSEEMEQKDVLDSGVQKCSRRTETNSSHGNTLMVGAVTAALGASALLVEQQNSGTTQTLSKQFEKKDGDLKGPKNVEEMTGNSQDNIITSLAEKAMSVASPVVPTKEDGEVDHERLVAMLAELGQKGGVLKLIGKIALLWGGIRGALSLTDKLISFLRMAERPLLQRIFGFAFMVIVLWSPVVVPLLPTLVQSWGNHNSPKIAELACVIGLYVSVLLMITLWGKRIRGFDNPLEQYGLDLTSISKVQNFAKGLVGGVMLVLLINVVNLFAGFVQASGLSFLLASSSNAFACLKVCERTLSLVFQGLVTATGIAVVEELLFRSWLPDEIATNLGYYRGIIISGLTFSLLQRSLWAIPGLWSLSVALAGARQRSQGSLSLPIGLRAGILASSFILQRGGFLTYGPSTPVWLCGSQPFEPFSGLVGLAFALLLAVILYPSQPLIAKKGKPEPSGSK